jgi:hypothetical protein
VANSQAWLGDYRLNSSNKGDTFFSSHTVDNMLRTASLLIGFIFIIAVRAFVTLPASNPIIDPL